MNPVWISFQNYENVADLDFCGPISYQHFFNRLINMFFNKDG